MKFLVCFGTRPEAIKMAPICKELEKRKLDFKICITGQHREMLDQVINFFNLIPDYDLDLMQPNQTLNALGSKILSSIDVVIKKEKPDVVLVQGDTTTAAVIALAAFYGGIKIGHVEAGLRTNNIKSPFPEEGNRQIISRIADFHFAPTQIAYNNLLNEGINKGNCFNTGNTVVDALFWAKEKIKSLSNDGEIQKISKLLDKDKKLILVTGHRRENFGKGLEEICQALIELATNDNVELLYPVHLNPQVAGPVYDLLNNKKNVHLCKPVSYPTMLWLIQKADLIISDSGGIQEEAPSFGKQVLVTRDFTERMEGVNEGFCVLTGTKKEIIVREGRRILKRSSAFGDKKNPYGEGDSAKRIIDILEAELQII